MQDRNPGNRGRLSQLLDSIDTPPDDLRLDKNAAWEKLAARRNEQRRKKTWLLWPAAAILLISAATAVFIYTQQKPGETRDQRRVEISRQLNPAREIPTGETIRLAPKTIQYPRVAASPVLTRRAVKAARPALEQMPALRPDTIAYFPPAIPETTSLAVTSPLPKKKLKQVHINELEPATGTQQELLTRKEKKRFFLYMNSGSATRVETMAGGRDPQIKIKINNN